MIDLLIRGGKVVFPGEDVKELSVGVTDERICDFFSEESAPEAREVIDIEGKYLFPGGVDPHVHFGITNDWSADFEIDSRAALAGGYTTVVCYYRHAPSYLGTMEALIDSAASVSSVDFAISLGVLTQTHWNELPQVVEDLGITSWKFYRQYEGRIRDLFGAEDALALDDADLLAFLRRCADISPRLLVCVHCEDMGITRAATAQVKSDPSLEHTLEVFARTSPGYSEALSVLTALYLARTAQTKNLYVVHLSSGYSVDLLEQLTALQRETATVVETTAHYLSLTKHAPAGLWAMVSPPIQDSWDRERLWEAVRNGTIQSYGSDHCATRPATARGGSSIWETDTGFGGLGLMLPLLLNEGHHKRGLPLERIGWLASAGPARAFGLYPRKGAMEVGADADFAVVDLDLERKVDVSLPVISEEYSVYDGMSLRGWPVATLLRGRLAWKDSEGFHFEPGRGEYLRRAA